MCRKMCKWLALFVSHSLQHLPLLPWCHFCTKKYCFPTKLVPCFWATVEFHCNWHIFSSSLLKIFKFSIFSHFDCDFMYTVSSDVALEDGIIHSEDNLITCCGFCCWQNNANCVTHNSRIITAQVHFLLQHSSRCFNIPYTFCSLDCVPCGTWFGSQQMLSSWLSGVLLFSLSPHQ